MKRFISACFLLMVLSGYGQGNLAVDSFSVSFRIRNAGITVDGTFNGLEAQLDFNPHKLKNSRIIASVDAATVNTISGYGTTI